MDLYRMSPEEIGVELKKHGISPSLLNWGDDLVRVTKIWFDEGSVSLCSDCGVSVPVLEPLNVASLLIEIEDAIIAHYQEQGIVLFSSFD